MRWREKLSTRGILVWYLLGVLTVPCLSWVINHTRLAEVVVRSRILTDTVSPADIIVVLGAGVTATCAPNVYSLRRALLGARLYREGRADRILFTGGVPKGMKCSVAAVMADAARESGVPDRAIVVESAARSTRQNAEFSAPILHRLGASTILLVTDRLHMTRSEACFESFGFSVKRASVPVSETATSNVEMLYWAFREEIAIDVYRWRGWMDARVQ